MEYRVSHFPMLSRFFLTANEKDFSLSLEMTVLVKRYYRIASFPTQERLFPSPLIKASHSSAYQK